MKRSILITGVVMFLMLFSSMGNMAQAEIRADNSAQAEIKNLIQDFIRPPMSTDKLEIFAEKIDVYQQEGQNVTELLVDQMYALGDARDNNNFAPGMVSYLGQVLELIGDDVQTASLLVETYFDCDHRWQWAVKEACWNALCRLYTSTELATMFLSDVLHQDKEEKALEVLDQIITSSYYDSTLDDRINPLIDLLEAPGSQQYLARHEELKKYLLKLREIAAIDTLPYLEFTEGERRKSFQAPPDIQFCVVVPVIHPGAIFNFAEVKGDAINLVDQKRIGQKDYFRFEALKRGKATVNIYRRGGIVSPGDNTPLFVAKIIVP